MSLAPFDTYCADAADQFQMRRWVVRAIILSLIIHAGLLIFFNFTKLESFRQAESAPVEPSMTLWHVVDLPPAPLTEGKFIPEIESKPVTPMPIPIEKGNEDLPQVSSRPAEIAVPAADREIAGGVGGIGTGAGSDATAQTLLEREMREATNGLLAKGTPANLELIVRGPADPKDLHGNASAADGVPGRATLDEILARPDREAVEGQPIGIDRTGGALFEYNSYELLPEAVVQLRKVGEFIRRYPVATFRIEGHTDAIGTAEYNQILSEKRAESVKQWLVQFMGIAPERIRTRGFGSSRLVVPADRSIEEQQINRRVEIVIERKGETGGAK